MVIDESTERDEVADDVLHCLECKCNVLSSFVSGTTVSSVYPYMRDGVREGQ